MTAQFVVVIHDPQRRMDNVTIGPFNHRDDATEEASRWREEGGRAMVRYLWDVGAAEMAALRSRRQDEVFP
jgi:hypothetical protein